MVRSVAPIAERDEVSDFVSTAHRSRQKVVNVGVATGNLDATACATVLIATENDATCLIPAYISSRSNDRSLVSHKSSRHLQRVRR